MVAVSPLTTRVAVGIFGGQFTATFECSSGLKLLQEVVRHKEPYEGLPCSDG